LTVEKHLILNGTKYLCSNFFNLCVKGKAWSCINELYGNAQSGVIINKCKWNYFEVTESVR